VIGVLADRWGFCLALLPTRLRLPAVALVNLVLAIGLCTSLVNANQAADLNVHCP